MEKQEYQKMYQQENEFWWYKVLHEIVLKSVDKYSNKKSLKIFDAGCGTGRMIELLNNKGEVEGMDFSADAVEYSKKRGLELISQGDINDWDFKENSYNCIICLDVLCHSSIKSIDEILIRVNSSLKSGGFLILNLPAFNFLKRDHDICVQTKERFIKAKTIELLKNSGFTIEKATYRMPLLFIIVLIQKFIRFFFKPKELKSDLNEIPKWINNLFYFLGKIENNYISKIGNLSFGSSLFIVARK